MEVEKKSSIAAVVLAYRPDSGLSDRVTLLREQVDRVYIVNNSTDDESSELLSTIAASIADIRILQQADNVGVAAGFNAGMIPALRDGHDYVIIFDQDSTVTPGMVDSLVSAHQRVGPRAGIAGPALRSDETGIVYRRESGVGAREVDVLISSGSLFSRELIEAIGLHDEALFIDYVDHEISLRARSRGFRNLKVFNAILDHRFGDSDPVTLLGRTVYLANYSPLRHYYAARNRLIVIRRYGIGRWFWEDLWFTAKAWVKLLLAERDRRTKISAALRGVRDGLRYPARG